MSGAMSISIDTADGRLDEMVRHGLAYRLGGLDDRVASVSVGLGVESGGMVRCRVSLLLRDGTEFEVQEVQAEAEVALGRALGRAARRTLRGDLAGLYAPGGGPALSRGSPGS